jgi:hypothetical protein
LFFIKSGMAPDWTGVISIKPIVLTASRISGESLGWRLSQEPAGARLIIGGMKRRVKVREEWGWREVNESLSQRKASHKKFDGVLFGPAATRTVRSNNSSSPWAPSLSQPLFLILSTKKQRRHQTSKTAGTLLESRKLRLEVVSSPVVSR